MWEESETLAYSAFQLKRLTSGHRLSDYLSGACLSVQEEESSSSINERLQQYFPNTWNQAKTLSLHKTDASNGNNDGPKRVGIVLSGGPAAGGHNVIAGVFDYLKVRNANSQLFGFIGGPGGICANRVIEITDVVVNQFRNLGGFDMLRSGRDKIETDSQKELCLKTVKNLELNGLVIVGGDDSNTNAAVLAEYFKSNNRSTCVVIGVPKTIDGDLQSDLVEISFGFDTAVRTYSEQIGNLAIDIMTSGKYYHFVRLMGRAASHITLFCALLTRPNLAIISEEIWAKKKTLKDIVDDIVSCFLERYQGEGTKTHGVILVPEGLVEFIPEFRTLIHELNGLLALPTPFDQAQLSLESRTLFSSLPLKIQDQLLLERDAHGNVSVSQIETEWLLIDMTRKRLSEHPLFDGPNSRPLAEAFQPQAHFFGYEGRSATPSLFDADYSYALGRCAAVLVDNQKTGYMACVRGLQKPVDEWRGGGSSLVGMMGFEERRGREVPVVTKALVQLNKRPFLDFEKARSQWRVNDLYASPGPVQFSGEGCDVAIINTEFLANLAAAQPKFEGVAHHFSPIVKEQLSPLQRQRLEAPIEVPHSLAAPDSDVVIELHKKYKFNDPQTEGLIVRSFPLQSHQNKKEVYTVKLRTIPDPPRFARQNNSRVSRRQGINQPKRRLRVGILLNGQQASGVANVLLGLFERLSSDSPTPTILGFVGGVSGFLSEPSPRVIELTRSDLALSRNQGGFTVLGRANRSECLLAERSQDAARVCSELQLDGLVLVGCRYTLTVATILTEYFLRTGLPTRILAIPLSQNNNVQSETLESSLGFDSATRVYSSLIGNLLADGASAAKHWQFIRLMGSHKSQIAVETALQTHPHETLVAEAFAAGDTSLEDVVADIADLVEERKSRELHYGTVLVPEGLIQGLAAFRLLIAEMQVGSQTPTAVGSSSPSLSRNSQKLLKNLPKYFTEVLTGTELLTRNDFTKLPTEKLLADMVSLELKSRGNKAGSSFKPMCFFLGYQARSSLPTSFDCSLGYALGALAAVALKVSEVTGYVTVIRNIAAESVANEWIPCLYPLSAFLRLRNFSEDSSNRGTLFPPQLPVVPSSLVRLQGRAFTKLINCQDVWSTKGDRSRNPGPIQFTGDQEITETLKAEHRICIDMQRSIIRILQSLKQLMGSGCSESMLRVVVETLDALRKWYDIVN